MAGDPMSGSDPASTVDTGASATPLTERERAIRALISGALLGAVLAALGRGD